MIMDTYMETADNATLEKSEENNTGAGHRLDQLNAVYFELLIPVCVVWITVATIGIVGNGLLFSILSCGRVMKRKPLRRYIMGLSLLDMSFYLVVIPSEIERHSHYYSSEPSKFYKARCVFNTLYMICCSFLLIAIALNRYRVVVKPFSARQPSEELTTRVLVRRSALVFAVLLLTWPSAVLCGSFRDTVVDLAGKNITIYTVGAQEEFRYSVWRNVYKYILSIIMIAVSIILVTIYTLIAVTVRKKRRMEMNAPTSVRLSVSGKLRNQVRGRAVPANIKIVFTVTIVFIVTYVTFGILSFFESHKMNRDHLAVFVFFFRSYYMHGAIMPLLYFKMDKGLRKYVKLLCFPMFKKFQRKESLDSQSSY